MSRANISANLLTRLGRKSQLSALLAEAEARVRQADQLKELLPVSLHERLSIRIDGSGLHLLAQNNAVAQLLRFHGPVLLRASGCAELHIRVGSQEPVVATVSTPVVERHLPAAAGRLLTEVADDLHDNPALAEALRRLARHADAD